MNKSYLVMLLMLVGVLGMASKTFTRHYYHRPYWGYPYAGYPYGAPYWGGWGYGYPYYYDRDAAIAGGIIGGFGGLMGAAIASSAD